MSVTAALQLGDFHVDRSAVLRASARRVDLMSEAVINWIANEARCACLSRIATILSMRNLKRPKDHKSCWKLQRACGEN